MFDAPPSGWVPPKRIDLMVMARDRLLEAALPVAMGDVPVQAVFEFALASNYWEHGVGSRRTMHKKVRGDIHKVAAYIRTKLALIGVVVVIEEVDHEFPQDLFDDALASGVDLRVIRCWQRPTPSSA
jgi:hypothetical protein